MDRYPWKATAGTGTSVVIERWHGLGRWHPVKGWTPSPDHGCWLPFGVFGSMELAAAAVLDAETQGE